MKFYKTYFWEIAVVLCILALFVLAGRLAGAYEDTLVRSIGQFGLLGMAVYIVVATVAVIIPIFDFLLFMPVAVTLWGSFLAALLSIVAWVLGAMVAFLLARRYGHPLVHRLMSGKKLARMAHIVPAHHMFFGVILLRIILPIDLVSYFLGLFDLIRFGPYVVATIAGITPFAFAFAYLSGAHVMFQLGAFLFGVIALGLWFPYFARLYKRGFE